MANDWIIDVLADLRTFAQKNGLRSLAAQLDETALVAAAEIASTTGKAPDTANVNALSARTIHRNGPARDIA